MQDKLNKQIRIIIAGPTPPPIGGVTIHVSRLLDHLVQHNIQHIHLGKSLLTLFSLLIKAPHSTIVHIHFSNAIVRWVLSLLFKWKGAKIMTTIHRDLNREKGLKKRLTYAAIKNSDCTLVLNDKSLTTAKSITPNCIKQSSFFPPIHWEELNETLQSIVESFKQGKSKLFGTNAFDLAYDASGAEIYQIQNLVSIFTHLPEKYGLIVSDPSGNNKKHILGLMELPKNILFIDEPHPFMPILKMVDCFIRATTTDGDSLSIKEALYVGTNVLASNCVDREPSCTLYTSGNNADLKQAILDFKPTPVNAPPNAFDDLLKLYSKYVPSKPKPI